jgi:hypothetical protein
MTHHAGFRKRSKPQKPNIHACFRCYDPSEPPTRSPEDPKSVAPALSPGFGYDDLTGVADGLAASAAFLRLASGNLPAPEEVEQLRAGLLAYCHRDTMAMVEVHRALVRLAVM